MIFVILSQICILSYIEQQSNSTKKMHFLSVLEQNFTRTAHIVTQEK